MDGHYKKLILLLLVMMCLLLAYDMKEHGEPVSSSAQHETDGVIAKPVTIDGEAVLRPGMHVSEKRSVRIVSQPVSLVSNSELSLWEVSQRTASLDRNQAVAEQVKSEVQNRFVEDSAIAWNREIELRDLSRQLRSGMTMSQATNILGVPSKTGTVVFHPDGPEFPGLLMNHTNGTWLIYSPHPQRIDMSIGDDFRVLELWFNPAGELADGSWMKPVRN